MALKEYVLCRLEEIVETQSKGFTHLEEPLLAIRKGEQVYVYRNQCPHLGLPLDWQPDQFLNDDNSLIQCATHGALFEIETGQCIYGPCQNQHLPSVPTHIKNGVVYCSL